MARRSRDSLERDGSMDFDDSDEHEAPTTSKKKSGRNGSSSSTAAQRRDQNRIAQREFRQRKQQKIRDLEARVEILSGGKDDIVLELRGLLRDLMTENQTLRTLIRGLSGFIGDGAGGLLSTMGWDMEDFEKFINRSETDTLYEAHQLRKKGLEPPPPKGVSLPPKRAAPLDTSSSFETNKRRKASDGPLPPDATRTFGMPLMSLPLANDPQDNVINGVTLFSDLTRQTSSPLFMNPASGPSFQPNQPTQQIPFATGYRPPQHRNSSADAASPAYPSNESSGGIPTTQRHPSVEQEERDPKNDDAFKLMEYHLENYQRNDRYCLPASMRPTIVQKTVAHEAAVDKVLHPELRDRMILLRGRFDVAECLWAYTYAIKIHGDDVLLHANWEIKESWLRNYAFLVDSNTLAICNKWRAERGEPPIHLPDMEGSLP